MEKKWADVGQARERKREKSGRGKKVGECKKERRGQRENKKKKKRKNHHIPRTYEGSQEWTCAVVYWSVVLPPTCLPYSVRSTSCIKASPLLLGVSKMTNLINPSWLVTSNTYLAPGGQSGDSRATWPFAWLRIARMTTIANTTTNTTADQRVQLR
ncbi:hypothetical protein P170DRAFT_98126 [Aspergillus steynii IBT 23096]|uniref:Uncharacterized protein n=1 Tax=Aspergillus steynii IBT 23096 TaxID=1392250 RepID=A0A2I2GGZ2_9EURO|nr:uncharacterized protein P170DRAFT_98126 [Aspergillus steynii IBT 23096]PLB52156.1 hypothetical protein P170DRAFT_98126 [Aspergillus steynii IBT 23096]